MDKRTLKSKGRFDLFHIRYATAADVPDILRLLEPYNMHHVPSPEMPELDPRFFYVAEVDGSIVGAAGFKLLSPEAGKTTLLGVDPALSGKGIGLALQAKRMAALKSLGCEKITTNADRPETIRWYRKHFGYRPVGSLRKMHSFGLPDVDHWTTLEADLTAQDLEEHLPRPSVPPLIINAALTGAVHSREDNPHLPITPAEIAADAERVAAEGAAIVHVHARDGAGKPTSDPAVYAEIIQRIRERRPDVVVCASTTGRWTSDPETRAAVLFLDGSSKPDMASLTLGSMNFPRQTSVNAPDTIRYLATTMRDQGIKPETEAFDLGMLDYAYYLVRKGYLELPLYNNTLLGSLGTLQAREHNAEAIRKALPIDTCWSLTGIGGYQRRMVEWAVQNGAHVRIGLEDNLYRDPATRAFATNTELVRMVRELAESAPREVATPKEARHLIGLANGVA